MTKVVPDYAVKRLISDIRDIKKNNLSKEGIYYEHDDSNIMRGYALIIGPKDTPYEYGNFLFIFDFPEDYPHTPPSVKFCTNDGIVRFHPNLYRNGKVCLSILNTWKGEQWTGCQTIRSVLLTIASILENNALLNEPGINENHKDVINYDLIIRYKTIETAIFKLINKNIYTIENFEVFDNIMENNFKENFENIINSLKKVNCDDYITTNVYGLSIKINKIKLMNNLLNLLKKIE
tara:strand:- start:1181 stop:1885 length:705 start_codon:yes stop_codon:yes gene_type:complete